MSNFISAISDLKDFVIDAMGDIASFFTTNVLGQIILGIALISFVVNIILMFVNKVHR